MTSIELEQNIREMPVGSWLRCGNGLAFRLSEVKWRYVPLKDCKKDLDADQIAVLLLTAEKDLTKEKIKNPTANPNWWAGPVEKPHFEIKKLPTRIDTTTPSFGPTKSEITLSIPGYLKPIKDFIDRSVRDAQGLDPGIYRRAAHAQDALGWLLTLLYDYQLVVERMPDWVFTSQNPHPDAVATDSSSVWPIDADRKYSSNPIEANDNRLKLANFILHRLGYSRTDPNFRMIRELAYKGASSVGSGPPHCDNHGRTCGEAVIRGIIEGLLDLIDPEKGS